MKNYELMIVIKQEKGEPKAKGINNLIASTLSDLGGILETYDFWGKRKFAYDIDNRTEGYYSVLEFGLDENQVKPLKAKLNSMPEILRYMLSLSIVERLDEKL